MRVSDISQKSRHSTGRAGRIQRRRRPRPSRPLRRTDKMRGEASECHGSLHSRRGRGPRRTAPQRYPHTSRYARSRKRHHGSDPDEILTVFRARRRVGGKYLELVYGDAADLGKSFRADERDRRFKIIWPGGGRGSKFQSRRTHTRWLRRWSSTSISAPVVRIIAFTRLTLPPRCLKRSTWWMV